MVWLTAGLLLAVFGGLVMVTRRARRRPAADETLVADLLGLPAGQAPRDPPAERDARPPPGQAPRDRPAEQDARPSPGQAPRNPPAEQDTRPSPVTVAQPAGEGDWLESQLAAITAWSDRMEEHITSWAADTDRPPVKPEPEAAAPLDDVGRRAGHEPRQPAQACPAPGRCTATTAKSSRCKLPARPGSTTCAIHAQQAPQ
jgi:hypothetical protein